MNGLPVRQLPFSAILLLERKDQPMNPLADTIVVGKRILQFDCIDSTNSYLKENAQLFPNGTVAIAREQYAGKGRRGRKWISQAGLALSMSVLLTEVELEAVPLLPLFCGVGASRALSPYFGRKAELKWPNDVLVGEKKLAGILCESRILGSHVAVVCGIGVNVLQPAAFFAENQLPYGTSILSQTGKEVPLEEIAFQLLTAFDQVLEQYRQEGSEGLLEEYSALCITLGREVQVEQSGVVRRGVARSVEKDGSLCCTGEEDFCVHGGEASVRGLYGYV